MPFGVPLQLTPPQATEASGLTLSFNFPGALAANSTVTIELINYNGSGSGITSVTVGGQTAALVLATGAGTARSYLYQVTSPTWASTAVVVTHTNAAGNYTSGGASEWDGMRLTGVVDLFAGFTFPNSTAPITFTTGTPTSEPQVLIGVFTLFQGNVANGITHGGGQTPLWTQQNSSATQGGSAAYKLFSALSAQTLTWTRTPSSDGAGVYATFQAVAPPPPAPEPTVDRLIGLDTGFVQRTVDVVTESAGAGDAGKVGRLGSNGRFSDTLLPVAAGGAGANLPAIMAQSAASAYNRNVRTRGLYAGPMTFTVGTSTPPAGHSRVYTMGAAGAPFAHSGGNATTSAGRTTFPVRGSADLVWRVATIVDSDSVGFLLDSATADGYRFIVEGQYISAIGSVSAAGSERYYRLQLGTKARREIIVEGNPGLGFWGAAVPDDGQCILPAAANAAVMYTMGDSDQHLVGFSQKGDSYALALADFLGFPGAWINSSPGTGFVVNGADTNYAGRRAHWNTAMPDGSIALFVFQVSWNDREQSLATIKAAVAAEIAAVRAKNPNAVIIVHGASSWNHVGSDLANLIASEGAAAEAVAEAGDPRIGFIPIYTAPGAPGTNPIIGTSAPGDTGTGNTPRYVSHAVDHMSPDGNIYFAQWLARRIIEKMAGMGGIPVPDLSDADIAAAGGSPAGSGTELQYRNGAAFGAVPGTSWNGTTLALPSAVTVSALQFVSNLADPGNGYLSIYTEDFGNIMESQVTATSAPNSPTALVLLRAMPESEGGVATVVRLTRTGRSHEFIFDNETGSLQRLGTLGTVTYLHTGNVAAAGSVTGSVQFAGTGGVGLARDDFFTYSTASDQLTTPQGYRVGLGQAYGEWKTWAFGAGHGSDFGARYFGSGTISEARLRVGADDADTAGNVSAQLELVVDGNKVQGLGLVHNNLSSDGRFPVYHFNGTDYRVWRSGEYMDLPYIADPLADTVAPDTVRLFGENIAGGMLPAFAGPSGLISALQPFLGTSKIAWANPVGNSTTLNVMGITLTATGTATAANVATTNIHTVVKRLEYAVTTAATTAVAGWRSSALQYHLGSGGSIYGGFRKVVRFGPSRGVASNATRRFFVGFSSLTGAPTDVEPSTTETNAIGVCADAADTNWHFVHRTASAAATKVSTGFAKGVADTSELYQLAMFKAPSTGNVGILFTRLSDSASVFYSPTTNVPAATTLLAPRGWTSVGGTSSVVGISLAGLYIGTDY